MKLLSRWTTQLPERDAERCGNAVERLDRGVDVTGLEALPPLVVDSSFRGGLLLGEAHFSTRSLDALTELLLNAAK